MDVSGENGTKDQMRFLTLISPLLYINRGRFISVEESPEGFPEKRGSGLVDEGNGSGRLQIC